MTVGSASALTQPPISCLDAHEFRDEHTFAKADQDAEASSRQEL